MNIIDRIVVDNKAPENKNVLWVDNSNLKHILKIYDNGKWNPMYGSGGGGGGDDSSTFDGLLYFGGRETELQISASIENVIKTFSHSNRYTTSNVNCNSKYYYIATPVSHSLKSVMTENSENVTSLFIVKGSFAMDGELFMLYELHLSSDMPLNVRITITVNR